MAIQQRTEDVDFKRRNLQLLIQIHPSERCPLTQLGPEATVEDIRSKPLDNECHCEFIYEFPAPDGRGRNVAHTERIHEDCPCCMFCDYGCIPQVVEIRDRSLLVETYVEDRDQAFSLMQGLDATPADIELVRISRNHDGDFATRMAQVDLTGLTDKQRAALDVAVARGYFDDTRGATLEELAEEFDISKQAFGQRLRTAERKVLTQLCRNG